MQTNRFINRLQVFLALLLAPLALAAAEPYSVVLTHHSAGTGDSYKVRFTIEGAAGIAPAGQGMGSDGGVLEGYAAPDGTITVTMEWVECSDPSGDLQYKRLDVWMGNPATNGDAMRDDEEDQFAKYAKSYGDEHDRVVYTFKCSDFKLADPSVSDATLMVNASSTVQIGSTQTETIIYLKLKLSGAPTEEGAHVTVDNEASKDDGSTNYTIPGVIGGILVAGGMAAYRNRKKKKSGERDDKDEKDDEDDEDDADDEQLEMEIYKDFGDTLVAGNYAERISACIIRKPKDGPEFVDEALTRQIEITSEDGYLELSDDGMQNGWRSALVRAPESENPPEEAIVIFRLAAPDGSASYTNRLHFKIQQGVIVFGQDNLTMPALHDEAERLPFLISGIDIDDLAEPPTVRITAKADDPARRNSKGSEARDGNSDYEAVAEWNQEMQLYEVAVTDLWQDAEQWKTYQAGDFLTYYIDVEAKSKTGFTVKGRLPLYRFYMGLALQMEGNDVGCYFEEYDPVHHTCPGNFIAKDGDKEVTPAHTRVWLKYYGWDKNTHRIVTIDPALKEDARLKVVALHESQQEQVDQLGLQLTAMTTSEGRPYYILRCRLGVLNAPNRLNVQLQMKAMVGSEECTFTRNVRLLSQKKPVLKSPQELLEFQKENNRIRELLYKIDNEIMVLGMEERLAPLVQYIQLQLDANYQDQSFGFDRRNVKAIQQTFHNVLVGEQGEANSHTLVACDNLSEVTWEYFKSMRTTVNDMGTFSKLFASVATLGLFDVATGVIEVVGEMKDYVDKGGDSVLGLFCVGAWQVTKQYLIEKGMQAGTSTLKNYVKTGGDIKNTWNLTKADVKDMVAKEINSVTEFGKRFNGAKDSAARSAQADKQADELVKDAKKHPSTASDYSDEAIKKGRERAQNNLDELQKSIDAAKKNPTSENIMRRNEAILACQQDKQTMMMLKGQYNWETVDICNRGVNFGECRQVLNNHLDGVYKATDKRVKEQLAKLHPGLTPDDVKIFGATSSDKAKLLSGKSVTFDRDVTYFYVDKTTKQKVYFSQRATEKIYAHEFYQVANSGTRMTASALQDVSDDVVKEFAKKMDQTVVEDVLKHAESYGIDLQKMLDKALHGAKLTNPEKVAEAVLYKGQERFNIAEKLMKMAKNMKGDEALSMQATAIGEILEGCRQQVKVFKMLNERDIARVCANGSLQISHRLRQGISILEKLSVKGNIDLKSAETALSTIGFTFSEITKEMYRTVVAIG